jgi:hypothetical protein
MSKQRPETMPDPETMPEPAIRSRPAIRPEPAIAPTGDPRAATRSLAWVEGRRLLRHPAVLAAVLLVLLIWVVPEMTGSADHFPVLYYSAFEIPLQLLPIAMAALIAANLGLLRAHRHGAEVFYDVTPLPGWQRTLAHVLSVLPLAIVTGLLGVARLVQLSLLPGSVGRPDLRELAVAPVLAAFLGVLGVLLGRVVRSAVVASMLLVFVVFTYLFGLLSLLPVRLWWLGPVGLDGGGPSPAGFGGPQPADLLARPAGAHLIYLVALVILVGTAALLRVGAPRLPIALTAAVAAFVAAITGALQVGPPPADVVAIRQAAANAPAASQRCERRTTVTYCAFPDFLPRVDEWDQIVDDIRRRIPNAPAGQSFTVRQRLMPIPETTRGMGMSSSSSWQPNSVNGSWAADDKRANTPDPVPVGTGWGQPEEETAFAARVAHRLVTGSGVTGEHDLLCGGIGVLTLWLAGQTMSEAPTSMAEQAANTSGRTVGFDPVLVGPMLSVGRREVDVAIASLGQPADRVAAIVTRSWPELTSPKTTVERAAEILSVDAPAKLAAVPAGEESIYGDCG